MGAAAARAAALPARARHAARAQRRDQPRLGRRVGRGVARRVARRRAAEPPAEPSRTWTLCFDSIEAGLAVAPDLLRECFTQLSADERVAQAPPHVHEKGDTLLTRAARASATSRACAPLLDLGAPVNQPTRARRPPRSSSPRRGWARPSRCCSSAARGSRRARRCTRSRPAARNATPASCAHAARPRRPTRPATAASSSRPTRTAPRSCGSSRAAGGRALVRAQGGAAAARGPSSTRSSRCASSCGSAPAYRARRACATAGGARRRDGGQGHARRRALPRHPARGRPRRRRDVVAQRGRERRWPLVRPRLPARASARARAAASPQTAARRRCRAPVDARASGGRRPDAEGASPRSSGCARGRVPVRALRGSSCGFDFETRDRGVRRDPMPDGAVVVVASSRPPRARAGAPRRGAARAVLLDGRDDHAAVGLERGRRRSQRPQRGWRPPPRRCRARLAAGTTRTAAASR